MKPLYKRIVLWTLLVLQVSLVFSFSLQDAKESSKISKEVTAKFKSTEQFENELRNEKASDGSNKYKDENAVVKIAERNFLKIEGITRKLAHISLFFVLGIILILLIMSYGMERFFAAGSSILFAAAVGFVDETIQLFSVGRAGMLKDVFIDLSGTIIASILFVAGGTIYEKIKKKRTKMDS